MHWLWHRGNPVKCREPLVLAIAILLFKFCSHVDWLADDTDSTWVESSGMSVSLSATYDVHQATLDSLVSCLKLQQTLHWR